MIKNKIAFTIILIAGIIILAHDIIPHHHHNEDAIEFTWVDQTPSEKNHHHGFPEHKHHGENCFFVAEQALVFSQNLNCPSNANDKNPLNFSPVSFTISYQNPKIEYPPPEIKFKFRENLTFRPEIVTPGSALRAPPIV